jgi:HK97 family phage major capsid protein
MIGSETRKAYDASRAEGRIMTGFGVRYRNSVPSRRMFDANLGRERNTFIFGEQQELAERWFSAYFSVDKRDAKTGMGLREITEKMNAGMRAPSNPLTGEAGQGAGWLVPLSIAAEIFEETTERFVLRNMVEVFTSNVPLRIPRRTALVTVTRGAPAVPVVEADPRILGAVTLTPERVGAIAYIDYLVSLAAAVGPVRYIIGQFAEALARDKQRCIIAGDTTLREPKGINTLPTSGDVTLAAKTATWVDSSNATRRKAIRQLFYRIAQYHRESARFAWTTNNDAVQVMASLNDIDQQPWKDATAGNPPTYMGKPVVESTAIVTNTTSTIIGGDFGQYGWLEGTDGIRMETTTEGGQAWESDTIGVKVIEFYDGAPIIPSVFAILPSVIVA